MFFYVEVLRISPSQFTHCLLETYTTQNFQRKIIMVPAMSPCQTQWDVSHVLIFLIAHDACQNIQ